MVDEPTLGELARAIERNERRFNDFVQKAIYDRDIGEIRQDISEIKGTVTWAARGVGLVFIAVIVDIIVRVAVTGAP